MGPRDPRSAEAIGTMTPTGSPPTHRHTHATNPLFVKSAVKGKHNKMRCACIQTRREMFFLGRQSAAEERREREYQVGSQGVQSLCGAGCGTLRSRPELN